MCLATFQTEPTIASEDLTVYKTLTPDLTSIYYRKNKFKYQLNQEYETEIKLSKENQFFGCIDRELYSEGQFYNSNPKEGVVFYGQGFHSFISISALKDNCEMLDWDQVVVKCLIPKGSEYYTNDCGMIVSNRIKAIEVIK